MKIQKIKSAFTLVELIVVITILAILATIAFISFQSSTVDVNNAKILSDIRNLVSKINLKSSSGISFSKLFLSWSTTNKPNSLKVYWWNIPADYNVWKINFWELQESSEDFKDNLWNDYIYSYVYTLISSNWKVDDYSYFQVAGLLIDSNWNKKAVIRGNYTPKIVWIDSPSLIAEKTDNTVFILNDWDATNMY